MKCDCKECSGTGEITCPECDGKGYYSGSIETIHLERNIEDYDELLELQKDAQRVIRQADRLKELKPERSVSYELQLDATLEVINRQVDQLEIRRDAARNKAYKAA